MRHRPPEQNLNLAREAFDRIGLPPERWDVAAVEWAKTLVEEVLRSMASSLAAPRSSAVWNTA